MTAEVKPEPGTRKPSRYGLRALHVFTLCGFAFTVPIFTALTRQAVYVYDQDFGWTEISAFLIGLTLVLPLAFVLADLLAVALSKCVRGWGRNTVLFVLFVLILLSIIRPYASARWIAMSGFAGYLLILLSLCGAATAIWLYEKTSGMRLWLTISAIGLLVFPGVFVRQFYSIRKAELKADQVVVARQPTNVVMVVFDEFSGTTLLNDQMEIDALRFPQFARLAKISTFYRNATSVHPRTIVAVPAILSGRFPEHDWAPIGSNYPGNLFQTIQSTGQFEMAVFEPETRIYSKPEHRHKSQQTSVQKVDGLVRTLSMVYLRLIVTEDLSDTFPMIPMEWTSVHPMERVVDGERGTEGRFQYSAIYERPQQLAHFLSCIKSSARPRFTFLHIELPHVPWVFFPTGEQYAHESSQGHPGGAVGSLGEDWLSDSQTVRRNEFRYRLQVGLVDRFVGRLLDRLTETGVLDSCLLIVTADHGVSFRPGHSRRLTDVDNLADIASVPLFIKLPRQKEAGIDDRNVETIDIYPTIAETLGMELPLSVDGTPVSQEPRRPRKTMYFEGSMTVMEPDLPQKRASVLRQFKFFGHDDLDHLPASAATHPQWHGRKISSFVVKGKPIPATLIDPLRDESTTLPSSQATGSAAAYSWAKGVKTARSFVKGTFDARELPEKPAELIVAVDGLVRDSEMTYPLYGREQGFEFLLPNSVNQHASSTVRLYLVNRSQNPPTLRPVLTSSEHLLGSVDPLRH